MLVLFITLCYVAHLLLSMNWTSMELKLLMVTFIQVDVSSRMVTEIACIF